jgi:ketosteroid isomerase-like protein
MSRVVVIALWSVLAASALPAQAATAKGRARPAATMSDTAAVNAVVRAYGESLLGAPPDPDKTAAFYARDGEMLPPGGAPVVGPDSIRSLLSGYSKFVVEAETMAPTTTLVMGGNATVWGDYTQRAIPPGQKAMTVGGRFVMHLVKQPDGKWLVRRLLVQPS